ncbi:MAG TPA: prepilin-type N-terminal cleavage/methylation domain-containing protein [Acetobacteraceae bacterium]|nr:prepilin-type N-terminal cleavage/methylation domain-containing protein [Acetobacteraceae bacterium]
MVFRHPATRHRILDQDGFTLLEVLVTLVVLGLLTVTLMQGVRVGLQAWALADRLDQPASGLETTDRTLRHLFELASPGEIRSRQPPLTGTGHALSFVTMLPQGFGARMTDMADVELRVASGHRLVLLWRPHYRRWIVAPPPPSAVTLLDGVERLDVAYWQPPSGPQHGGWMTAWTARELPPLVRLHITFLSGSKRNWPDIVVAPMRELPSP